MEESQKNNVGRALTTDEIRLRASKWTLAGDAGLLAHLEQFSQSLQSKSRETQNNINALYDAFEDASTTINNVTNQFLALQNSQFVENRVYDDESPNEEQKIDEKVSKEEQEKFLLAQYKKAVEVGVKILDTHFEEVQLPPNSDSDEEEVSQENPGLVWKSKNPYARKRFPLLIGSAEWWADDNVGLGEYEENLNAETVSTESESDMEEEHTTEKRIRMSSSSSGESDRIANKKSKEQINADYNDIFAPVGKDLLSVGSNVYANDNSNLIKSPNTSVAGESNPLGVPEIGGGEAKPYLPKQNKDLLFDGSDDGNSDEESNTEPTVPVTRQNKIASAFTKELESKLSSVVNKSANEVKPVKNEVHKSEEKSALFDDNDDDEGDDLFSNRISAPSALLKKKSIFAERDNDDELFGNSERLFSDSNKGETPKKSVKINAPLVRDGTVPKESRSSSNLFDKASNDDLFGGNDDFLFTGKSGLVSSHNSGAPHSDWKTSQDVKFSTPTEQGDHREVPGGDIFGGVSDIRSNASSNVESVSAVSNEINNSFNFSRVSSVDNSKDYGFVEPSDLSNSKSTKVESPGLFDPLLSSTRHIVSDTSDYKTHRTTLSQITQTKSESSVPQSQDNSSSKMGHSENAHYSRHQSDVNKSKGLFDDEDDDDDDDLFQPKKSSKSAKENTLFDDNDNDYLFGGALPKVQKRQSVSEEKEENSVVQPKPPLPPAEDDEEERLSLADKLKQDSVSMSSSRSSLFDDANVGKTNLASVFDNEKSSKNANDLFGKMDDNLFEEKKTKTFGENDVEDLFGDNVIPETKTKISSSLFDDLEDADDLFRDSAPKKVFQYQNDDGDDLFAKPVKDDKNSSSEGLFGDVRGKSDSVTGSKASPNNKTEPVTAAKKSDDDIFGGSDELVKNANVSNAEQSTAKEKPKTKSSGVSSLFGELEDEDEDLFSTVKTKESKTPLSKVDAEPVSKIKARGILNYSSEEEEEDDDDAIFKAGNSKAKTTEPAEVERVGVATGDESSNKGPSLFNGKSEKNVISGEKSEEKKVINTGNTNASSINDDNDKHDLFSEKDNLFDDRTSDLAFSGGKLVREEKKVDEVRGDAFKKEPVDDGKRVDEKTGDGIRPSPPNSLNIAKRLSVACNRDNDRSETDGLVMSSEKEKVIGKLNIPAGLKINPMSLLPGATLKKPVTVETSPKKGAEEESPTSETSESLDRPSESAPNLLKCLSKDRVKIQARRRPQTRRARHEALRSSGVDFEVNTQDIGTATSRSRSVDDFAKDFSASSTAKSSSDTNVNDPSLVNSDNAIGKAMQNADSSSSVFHSVENSPEGLFSSPLPSNPLSPSTDEEDYFNVPELDVNFEKEDQSIFKSSLTDFKRADNIDDSLLFDNAPVLSPLNSGSSLAKKEPKQPEDVTLTRDNTASEREVTVEDEDDDNLFKVNETKSRDAVGKKSEVKFRSSNIFDDVDEGDEFLFQKKPMSILGAKEVGKKTLFDDNDEDDDDDLFGEKSDFRSAKSKAKSESVSVNRVNKSNIGEKSKEAFVDPLGLITKTD